MIANLLNLCIVIFLKQLTEMIFIFRLAEIIIVIKEEIY